MLKRILRLALIGAAAAIAAPMMAQADLPESFAQAKRLLPGIYAGHEIDAYCGCVYDEHGPIADTCGLEARKNPERSSRIEWEHVMPAHAFGQGLQCWQDGGRKACRRDALFRRMEADLHNLVPAVGELNGDRSNFALGIVSGEPREYGACDFEVSFADRIAEPPPDFRGDAARIYLYMSTTYGIPLTLEQYRLFARWSVEDPESDWEREKRRRITELQGAR